MWILIGIGIVLGLLIFIGKGFDFYECSALIGIPIVVLSAVFIILVLALPAKRMEEKGEIRNYFAVKAVIESARAGGNSVESATLLSEVIKTNKWLVNSRYWNESVWDIYIPDKVMELRPLK